MSLGATVHLVTGSDPVLVNDAVTDLVHRLVGDGDRSLLVTEVAGPDYELGALVDAAQTPPFLTERRVVVGRHLSRFSNQDLLAPLLGYLGAPQDTTSLVLVWEKVPEPGTKLNALPKKLKDAVAAAGGEVVATDVADRGRKDWVRDHLAASDLKLDHAAETLVVERLGEDVAALGGLVARLVGAYGAGARLGIAEVEPFLGEAGGILRYELTGAIESGDVSGALDKLHRLLHGSDLHALQILATLHGWAGRLLRLDGAGVGGEKEAAQVLGMKGSTYPARKALEVSRRLGHDGIVRSITLIAEADLAVRGAVAWPDELVLEVLVARLARLAAPGAGRGGVRPARRR